MKIHILGASRSGVSKLGNALATIEVIMKKSQHTVTRFGPFLKTKE